ncbi:GGDEF domain-containing phosphodiesterase [Romboutsia sedimentorum]|uniref:GGDEF domain-containing phosphodiesterase n=1 Tax=Romboutsia sedimentorum TaxID=1368474 RepID=UPI0024DEC714|nr:GGDEF domain-containing phosphodiesterase [Romboutsia sedimentorum]MDK2585807.1 GGDEF domain-containing phosphodiesterase [Romboutsia sedimentorum]
MHFNEKLLNKNEKYRFLISNLKIKINKRDKFTDLYNRNHFFYSLRTKNNGTLIKIKIMGINFVNLQYGVKQGDEVIKYMAKKIKNMRSDLIVGRLSPMNFAIYTENTDINYIHQMIKDVLLISSSIKQHEENISISCNVASIIYKEDDFNLEDCMNKLEISMSDAIRKGINRYVIYNEKYETYINIADIEKAIENGDMTLYYQPKVDAKTGEIKGVEALIRWFNKEHGYITPEKLIGFTEKCGYINKLGAWIIKKACEDIKQINKILNTKIDLSVNISPYQLEDERFLEKLEKILKQVEFEYSLLKLEITENENMEDIDRIQDILKEIKDTGIKVSIDDFGKGFNSIDYIKNYNVDEIKIDKSLVEYLSNNPMFIQSLISMIHTTDTSVVAEGVEQKSEYVILKNMGCDLVQGYYCYKPMNLENLSTIIKNDNT